MASIVLGGNYVNEKRYRLLELNSELLKIIEGPVGLGSIVMKAEGDEELILATDCSTFAVKEADTSNAVLLIPSVCHYRATRSSSLSESLSESWD